MRWIVLPLSLLLASSAAAQPRARPAHCERSIEEQTWPAAGEPEGAAPAGPPARAEALRLVRRFRVVWRGVPHRGRVLHAFTECMNGSLEHFYVHRVEASVARQRVGAFPLLWGDASRLSTGWVWEVYWGGASRGFPPSGPVSAFFAPDGRTLLVALQWLEG